jgi:hypothetical protein
MTTQFYDQSYVKVGSHWVLMGFVGAPVLGLGWVWVREIQPGPRLGWVLGRYLRPKLGYAEVYVVQPSLTYLETTLFN